MLKLNNKTDRQLAKEFTTRLLAAFRKGELDVLNELLRPLVHGVDTAPDTDFRRYIMSARFLQEAYDHLFVASACDTFAERFFYVGGYRLDAVEKTYIWDHLVAVEYDHQSAGGVLVNVASSSQALQTLTDAGLMLVGHVHSHPGTGCNATRPSTTDQRFIDALARGRSAALGAIFARGSTDSQGFIRFYADKTLPFTLSVQGSGIKEIDDYVYEIQIESRQRFLAKHDFSSQETPSTRSLDRLRPSESGPWFQD